MAIQKNFVIKNGLEVDTNLIVADAQTNKVGIGTTVPQYTLHVNGGIGATDLRVTDLRVTGVGTFTTLNVNNAYVNTAYINSGVITSFASTSGTITSLSGTNLNYSGISTLGILTSNQITSQNLNVTGVSTFNNIVFDGYVSTGGTTGSVGQVLVSTGVGVTWSKFTKDSLLSTAAPGQDTFLFTYDIGSVEIYINGVRLAPTEFEAINGSSIILNDLCFGGETVEILATQVVPIGEPIQIGITVEDEGSTVGGASSITLLNFIGSGVTVTSAGAYGVDITISGPDFVRTSAGIHTLGNVGIGTTNPTTELSVNGVISFRRNNIRLGDSNTGSRITTGNDNVFIGVGAGSSTTNGDYNNFLGLYAGYYNTSGECNNFFGNRAGYYNTSGDDNNFFGKDAGYYNTSGYYNNFFGRNAGCSNTTGSENNFFGKDAGYYNTSGYYNNFFGPSAGRYNTTGGYNTFLGSYSGISTSASRKVILGSGGAYNQLFDAPDTTKDNQFAVGVRTDANPANYWLVGNENFNVGIGTTNPQTKLSVVGNVNVSGIVTATGGFISVGNTTPIQISLVGNQLTFNAVGIGSTTLTLF